MYQNMECETIYDNKNKNFDKIVMVTCFFDIGRNNWKYLNRTPDYYLDSLKKMILLYSKEKIIIFMDDKYFDNEIIKTISENYKNILIIKINLNWLNENCDSWKKNYISEKIMNSNEYKKNVIHRPGSPENLYSEYNTINHSKIDLIKYSINNNLINDNEFICWCDCGYFKSILHNNPDEFPNSYLDINKFNLNKLNFCLRNEIVEKDSDMIYTLINAPETFTGSFFAGSKEMMLKLHELYHICLNELYENNISDDDQHVYLRCYLKNKELFELFISNKKWPDALVYFSKKFENRFDFIKYYIENIKYANFAEIGVCGGVLSEFILKTNLTSKLYCIDPYISYNDYEDSCNNETGDILYNSTFSKIKTLFNDRVDFIREFSEKAVDIIPNNLDFVYIDGNHKFNYVLKDLELYYEKIKIGGFLICDDAVDTDEKIRDENGDVFIIWNSYSSGKYGTIKACKTFANKKNIPYFKFDNQIIIFKF
jgi:hypothetical protein